MVCYDLLLLKKMLASLLLSLIHVLRHDSQDWYSHVVSENVRNKALVQNPVESRELSHLTLVSHYFAAFDRT